jgi:hypothetical protein
MNRKLQSNNSSGFKGITWSKGAYHARICVEGKRINLGRFCDAVDAATAYDNAAIKYFGEFARLNFKPGDPLPTSEETDTSNERILL